MNATLLIIVIALMFLCVLFMRRIIKLEYSVYTLNEKLNLSDEEYIDLFNINLELSDKISDFKVLEEIKKVEV